MVKACFKNLNRTVLRHYFIVTSKTIREDYLEAYLSEKFHDYYLVFGHYGNLRGINDAQDCDVCIMLGGFDPSDAVEIAMAIELIKDKLEKIKYLGPMESYGLGVKQTPSGSIVMNFLLSKNLPTPLSFLNINRLWPELDISHMILNFILF